MTYKLLGFAVVLLIATPTVVSAQKMSPIIVKTGDPVPSAVKSGEPFKVTYQVEYTDVVLIVEERMRLNTLALVVDGEDKLKMENAITGSVEVVDLLIGEKFRDGSDEEGYINVQNFTYTFMIINERKGNYKIPSFNFVWVEKTAGVSAASVREIYEFPTKEVGISYITSIVKPPPIDVKDAAKFDNFDAVADKALIIAYGTIGLASLLIVLIPIRFFRKPKSKEGDKDKVDEVDNDNVVDVVTPAISSQKSRKMFLRGLKVLESKVGSGVACAKDTKDATYKLFYLVWSLCLAESLEGSVEISDANTPKEAYKCLENLSEKRKKQLGRRYGIILELARRSKYYYYENMQADEYSLDLLKEIGELRRLFEDVSFWNKTRRFIRKLVSRG